MSSRIVTGEFVVNLRPFMLTMQGAAISLSRAMCAYAGHSPCRCVATPVPVLEHRSERRMRENSDFIREVGAKERAIAVEWFEGHAIALWESLGMERPTNIVRGES